MCATGTYYWYLLRTNYLPGINHRFQCINSFFIRININILFLSLCTKVRFPTKSNYPSSQVVGITLDTINFVEGIFVTEMNSATDNPLVFGPLEGHDAKDADVISAG